MILKIKNKHYKVDKCRADEFPNIRKSLGAKFVGTCVGSWEGPRGQDFIVARMADNSWWLIYCTFRKKFYKSKEVEIVSEN